MLTWITLHDVDELPPPRFIAYALADLGRDLLEQARLDLDAWDTLGRQGVPAKFRRELIFEPELEVMEPMQITREWHEAGSLGPLVLVGDVGTGKSHALAWWARARHTAGELTHWEPVSRWRALAAGDLRARHASLLTKPALILDDIGAGGMSDWHKQIVESLVVARHEAGLPTAVAMNATRQQVMDLLGRRAVDRIIAEGGTIRVIGSVQSLRRAPAEGVGADGRGPRWRWAKWALDAIGCAMVSRGDGDAYVVEPSYGDKLADRLARAGWLAEAEKVRAHLGLSVVRVITEAQRQHEELETDPVLRLAAEAMGQMRAAAAEEERNREDEADRLRRERMTGRGPSGQPDESTLLGPQLLAKLASLECNVHAARIRAKGRGFSVRESYDGFEVRYKASRTERGQLMADRCSSEDQAWVLADHGFDTM